MAHSQRRSEVHGPSCSPRRECAGRRRCPGGAVRNAERVGRTAQGSFFFHSDLGKLAKPYCQTVLDAHTNTLTPKLTTPAACTTLQITFS